MDIDARRRIVRAARVLLQWDQERFAKALGIGMATLKRHEAGYPVSAETEMKILSGLADIGVVVIDGAAVGGRRVTAGVALLATAVIGEPPPLRTDAGPDVRKKGVRSAAPKQRSSAMTAKPASGRSPKRTDGA